MQYQATFTLIYSQMPYIRFQKMWSTLLPPYRTFLKASSQSRLGKLLEYPFPKSTLTTQKKVTDSG